MQPEATSDIALLRVIANGDRGALGTLYDRYAPLLEAIGRRIVHDSDEVEDIVHEVFMEVWKHAGEYEPARGSVRTWITLRMRSRCLDLVRSVRVRRSVPVERADLVAVAATESGASDHGRVRQAVAGLPTSQREVLELGYFEGLSCSEIAARLALPIGTVKSRLSAALQKLRATVPDAVEELP